MKNLASVGVSGTSREESMVDSTDLKRKMIPKKLSFGNTVDVCDSTVLGRDESCSDMSRSRSISPMRRKSSPEGLMHTWRRCYTQERLNECYPSQGDTISLLDFVKDQCRCSASCVLTRLGSFLPILNVLKTYSWSSYLCLDIINGISVGFLHLPQGLGFGLLANLSPVNGLYTSLFPVFAYMIFGTSPYVSMGTNAVVALLSADIVEKETVRYLSTVGRNQTASPAALLEFKVGVSTAAALAEGIILIGMGLLRLGFLTNYMSNSFIGGFSFAAAVHITVSQIVKLLNLKVQISSGLGKLIFTTVNVFKNITETNIADVIVGIICGVLILGIKIGINDRYKHRLKVPIPAELVIVVLSTMVSHFAQLHQRFDVGVVGEIPTGLPAPSVPPTEVILRIIPDAFVDAILIFVLTITLAKLTAKLHVISIDDNQELVAYGMCQVVGSFFRNFSSSISPPRTMMLSSMDTKSTLNGLSTSVFLLLVLLVAGQLFESLPIAMLSIMIILAMKDLLLQGGMMRNLWYVNKGDFFIWFLTVLFGVLGDLSIGLLAGTVSSMVMVLAYSQLAKGTLLGRSPDEDILLDMNRQRISPIPGVRIFRFESQLHFASAERFKSEIYSKIFDPTNITYKDNYEIDVTSRSASIQVLSSFSAPKMAPAKQTPSGINVQKAPTLETSNTSVPDPFFQTANTAPRGETNKAELSQQRNTGNGRDIVRHVILDCSTMTYIDLTGVAMLHLIITQFSRAGVAMLLTDIPPTTLAILTRVKFFEHENYSKVYFNILDALHDIEAVQMSPSFFKTFA